MPFSRLTAVAAATFVLSQVHSAISQALPSSFPHNYTGIPSSPISPEWQSYFEVTEPLTNVTFDLGRNWAGNIPVGRPDHPNNTLFFWAFETRNGSLTAAANENEDEPWGIWLNGGPGSSSMVGLLFENGPIRIENDYDAGSNEYSWDKLADYIWIDQPVGTGFATADADGYITDEDQMGRDFLGFLENLVKVFPSLATRPLHLTGESYAGYYIPYITKAYFGMENPPVKLAKIAIGDGSIASGQVFELLPALTVIETYPQIIGYDQEVYEYFRQQSHLCGYDINLTYPQIGGPIPGPALQLPTERDVPFFMSSAKNKNRLALPKQNFMSELSSRYAEKEAIEGARSVDKRFRQISQRQWKRDLSGRAQDGTIDSWYGCLLLDEFLDYALNFTFPWTLNQNGSEFGFDVYDVPDALSPEANMDGSVFLNDDRTRAAIHAPTSKDWVETFDFVFGDLEEDPSPEPMIFLTEMATNASEHGLSVILYSGNDDTLIEHRGTEVTIQNTTFGGIQGFTRKPATPWTDDEGNFAGIVHQERNWTYVLFKGAGHLIPIQKPLSAFTFLREFVLGKNDTGLVTNTPAGEVSVIGGEDPVLAEDVMPGQDEIYYGSGSTQSTYVFPTATREAWSSFIRTATATGVVDLASPTATANAAYDGTRSYMSLGTSALAGLVFFFVW